MRRRRFGFGDDTTDFGDFVHQVHLGRQTAGGIGQHDMDAAGAGRLHRIEYHSRRIAALLRNHADVIALAPGLQLFAGRSAKGIASGQQHGMAVRPEMMGQFAQGGRFAGTVDAGHHDDERRAGGWIDR